MAFGTGKGFRMLSRRGSIVLRKDEKTSAISEGGDFRSFLMLEKLFKTFTGE